MAEEIETGKQKAELEAKQAEWKVKLESKLEAKMEKEIAAKRDILETRRANPLKDQQATNPLIEAIRADYEKTLAVLDNEVGSLIKNGQEAKALMLCAEIVNRIVAIHDMLSILYSLFYNRINVLKRFNSERLKMLGYDLQPIRSLINDPGISKEEVNSYVLTKLISLGFNKYHWLLDQLLITEIEYMLDALCILVEPDFIPFGEDKDDTVREESDRYIPRDIKLSVWRRDQGKCVECGSKEKLEYDHIIPISKGGSNTERNIQLLCEKCNREKSAKIM